MSRSSSDRLALMGRALLIGALLVIAPWHLDRPLHASAASWWYVSTSGNDNNDCLTPATACATIGAALGKAASGDTIAVAAGTYVGPLTIAKDVAILGAGAGATVIDGGLYGTTLTVSGGSVVLDGVTVTRGNPFGGHQSGGISNLGQLTLRDSEVAANLGAGVVNAGNLTMSNTTVHDNRCTCDGGGVVNVGTMTIVSSTISQNQNGSTTGGGGIQNMGVLTVTGSLISGNTGVAAGGLIAFNLLSNATVIQQSTIANNTAFGGNPRGTGGIADGAPLTVTDSTIADNVGNGLAYNNDINVPVSPTIRIDNSTIAGNSADGFVNQGIQLATALANTTIAGNGGIGIDAGGTVTIADTIDAGNGYAGTLDCVGTLVSLGYNILGSGTGCGGLTDGVNGDQVGTATAPLDPRLGPLQDNGGTTPTRALLPGSPAINRGNSVGCRDTFGQPLTSDQRGDPRPDAVSGLCDVGAYEAEPPVLAATPPTGTVGVAVAFTGTYFAPFEPVSLYWDGLSGMPLLTTTVAGDQTFAVTGTLPHATFGGHTVAALGQTSELSATTSVSIVPSTTVAFPLAVPRQTDAVTGTGFGAGEPVGVHWGTIAGRTLGVGLTDGAGDLGSPAGISFTVPLSPAGTYSVVSAGEVSGAVATGTVQLGPVVRVVPASGLRGSRASVRAAGFGSHESLTLAWDCAPLRCRGGLVLGRGTTRANGAATVAVTIPLTATPGLHAVLGIGQVTGLTARGTYRVTS